MILKLIVADIATIRSLLTVHEGLLKKRQWNQEIDGLILKLEMSVAWMNPASEWFVVAVKLHEVSNDLAYFFS